MTVWVLAGAAAVAVAALNALAIWAIFGRHHGGHR